MSFVHLHLHSEYSLLDGAFRIADIPKAAKACGHNAVAITDHGAMYGVVNFYRACKEEGIKPIIGCEVYTASESRFDRREAADGGKYHLVLLAENETGYKNLIYMVSRSYTEGFYGKPRIDMELLREHSEGLIALSACLAGYIPRHIMAGDFDGARERALEFDRIFGHGNFYLELQDHGMPEQKEVNEALIAMSRETGIPLVATNDVHYMRRADADTQAVLLCIQTNSRIADGRPIGFETDEFYYKSTEEMERLFSSVPEAAENTQKIADRCNYDFDFSHIYLPRFTPETGETPEEYLRRLSYEGFESKKSSGEITFTEENSESTYRDRIEYELSVISKMGYAQYYLIVWDFIAYAKREKIPVGPGRGSGAGSLIAYLCGITDVDSIKYDLMFERFLNPERVSMPDFDTDFCYDRRGEVIEYVSRKYGADHVCGISTFGTLAAKAVVRDVGRALGMSYADVDIVAKAIPYDPHITLREALTGKLKRMYDENEQVRRLIDISMALEGMPRHASAHAAGIVITDKPAYEHVPLAVNNEMVLTQFTMDIIEKLGLLKFDFLGLRYLTIISDTEKQIRKTEPDFDITKVSLDDAGAYELISQGRTSGIFQLESSGMRRLLMNMQPRNIEDITLAISLYRPGPMESIPQFLRNRTGESTPEYKIPSLRKILEKTSGCIIYQEQVMQICREVAGFSFGRADIVRRAMAKKKTAEMEKARTAFVYGEKDENGNVTCEGAVARGTSEADANEIFDTMSSFAKYAFNKSHATAYAYTAYRTAYLKCHYPSEYLASLLTSVLGNVTKTVEYIEEAKSYRISVLSPDINESEKLYSVVTDKNGKKAIRYGLLGVKNVGANILDAAIEERKNGRFTSFVDFVSRMCSHELNKRQIEGLIKSGAFDSLGTKRSMLLAEYENVLDIFARKKSSQAEGQLDLFSAGLFEGAEIEPPSLEYEFKEHEELPLRERLKQEKESTGMYFSGHPLDEYAAHIEALGAESRISDILLSFDEEAEAEPERRYADNERIAIAGIITTRTNKQTKNGGSMAFATLEDKTGEIELIFFSKVLEKISYMINPDSAIAAAGRVSAKEDSAPKLIVSDVVLLRPAFNGYATPLLESMEDVPAKPARYERYEKKAPASNPAPEKRTEVPPKKLYLKIPDMSGEIFERVSTLLQIFEGGCEVIFYDISQGKYIKAVGMGASPEKNMLLLLREILGDGAVVTR